MCVYVYMAHGYNSIVYGLNVIYECSAKLSFDNKGLIYTDR